MYAFSIYDFNGSIYGIDILPEFIIALLLPNNFLIAYFSISEDYTFDKSPSSIYFFIYSISCY